MIPVIAVGGFACRASRPSWQRTLGGFAGDHLRTKQRESVAYGLAGFAFLIADRDVELLLETHGELHHVERIGTQIGRKMRIVADRVEADRQMIRNDSSAASTCIVSNPYWDLIGAKYRRRFTRDALP